MKLSDAALPKQFRLLQCGESGSGKTHRSLTATRFGSVLVIDVDNKLSAMKGRIPAESQQLIELVVPTSYDGALAAIRSASGYATVVLDTWSRIHDLTIEKHKQANPKLVQLTLQDWGAVKSLNRQFLNALLALPCNIIVNTHVGKDKDALDRQILTVGTTGSFGTSMPEYFNETHFLFIDGGKFKVQGLRGPAIVANTSRPDSLLDERGMFKTNDLSIFDDIAYRGKP